MHVNIDDITSDRVSFQIIEDLDEGDETSGLRFGGQLDEIVQLMDS